MTAGSSSRVAARARSSEERTVKVCGRSVIRCRMARKSPDAASRPAMTTRMRSATRSTSSRMWLEKRIVQPTGRQLAKQPHGVQPLTRVHAVERLVEEEDLRLVDERGGDLGPLAHPLGVGLERPVLGVNEVYLLDGPRSGRGGVSHSLQAGIGLDELAAGEERVVRPLAQERGRCRGRRSGRRRPADPRRSLAPPMAPGTRR